MVQMGVVMTLALLLVIIAVVLIMTLNGRGQVPWSKKMRRIHAGAAHKAEWMATDEVVQQVRADYLAVTRWIHDYMLTDAPVRYQNAPHYLSGNYLKQFQTRLAQQFDLRRSPGFVGVLRADHQVSIRHFTASGESCLVVDYQTQRRMATYNARTHTRLLTQDLGSSLVVYRMVYDLDEYRWKIDDYVQELPAGWNGQHSTPRIREILVIPDTIGRDS